MRSIYRKFISIRPVNPIRITLLYLVISLCWIFFSDRLIILTTLNYSAIAFLSVAKGFLFVFVTSAMLYFLTKNAIEYAQRQYERSLESEKAYKLISENINDVVWIYDIILGKFSYVSPSVIKQRGFTPEEIYQQKLEDNISPQFHHLIQSDLYDRLHRFENGDDSAKIQENELDLICKDGSVISVKMTTSLVKNSAGKVVEICGRAENITDKKITQNALNALAISFSSLSGKTFFEKVSEHIAITLEVDCVYVGQLSNDKNSIQVLGGVKNGLPISILKYDLKNSPCEKVVGQTFQTFPANVQEIFPQSPILVEMNADSYMGAPLFGKHGNSLGLIVTINSGPIKNEALASTLFKIFSEKVVAEIERSNAEEKILKSEEKYHKLFDINQDGIAIFPIYQDGSIGKFIELNDAAIKLQGYSKEEMLQFSPNDLEIGVTKEMILKRKSDIENFGVTTFDTLLMHRDGHRIDVEIKAIPIIYNHQPALMNIIRDITERKKNEEALKQSEARYDLIARNSLDVIWLLSLETKKFTYVSPSVYKLRGFTPDEVLNQSMEEVLTPDSYNKVIEQLAERLNTLENGDQTQLTNLTEVDQPRKDGSIVHTEVVTTFIMNEFGKVHQILGVTRDITERKKVQNALKESEARYELISKNSADVIWILNMESFKMIYVSPSIERLTGFTQEEVLNQSLAESLIPDSIEFISRNMGSRIRAFLSGNLDTKTTTTEIGQYRKDGSIVYTEALTTLIANSNGEVKELLGVSRDITERKLVQEALEKSESNLSSAMKIAKLGHWEYDVEKNLFFFNDQFYDIMHCTFEDVGSYFISPVEYSNRFVHPDDQNLVEIEIRKALESTDPNYTSILEHRIIYGDGGVGFINVHINLVKDSDGKTIKTYGVNQDITEKKLIEEAIKESEERYKELYNHSPDSIIVHQNGIILFVNPATLKIFDAQFESEIVGKKMMDFVAEDYREVVLKRMETMTNSDQPVGLIYEKFLRLDGTMVDVEVSSTPIKLKGKIAYQVIARDITERKKVEDTMRASEEKFSKMFNNAPILIVISTFNNPHYIEANQMCCELSGYTREEIIGKSAAKMSWITSEDRKRMEEEIEKNGSIRELPIQFVTKDQKVLDCLYYGEVIVVQDEKCLLSIVLDITVRKRTEELILESEQKLSALINATPDIICFKDAEGRWLKANQGILDVYGLSNYDYTNKNEWDMAPYTFDNLRNAFRTCGLTDELAWLKGTQSRTEEMIPDKNDIPRIFDVIKVPLFYENGNRKALVVFGRDITDRKKSEQALRAEKDKFSKTFFTSPDGVIINKIENAVIIELNTGFENISGFTREELINKSSRELDIWVEDDKRKESKQKILSEGNYQNLETKLRRKDKELVDVLLSASRIEVDETKCVLYLIRDISDIKKAERALRESEERYRDLFDHLLDGFAYHELILDENENPVDYIFLAANYRFEILTGLKVNNIIGKSVKEVLPEKWKFWVEMYSSVAINGVPKRFENYNDDTKMHHRIIAYSPEKLKFACIIENVTEKVLAENELKLYRTKLEELVQLRTFELDSANKQLEDELRKDKEYEMMLQEALKKEKELGEIKTRFISTASHEFRTPLTSILSSTELVERYRKKWPDEKFDEHFSRVKSSVEYLTKLLDDVLLISRTDAGKISFDPTETALKEFCKEIIREASVYSKSNHSLIFDYQAKRKCFMLDQKLFKFILINILSNAYKYSPVGGKVELLVKNNRSNIIISVKDEGIGIPQEEIPLLFEPFHRSKNSKDIPGTGLGLSIVKRSVDLYKGRIILESELDRGTTFTIYLPIQVINDSKVIAI